MSGAPRKVGTERATGRVVAVRGSVIDVVFAEGFLPKINESVAVDWDIGAPLVAEVQQHLGPERVRVVALENPAGLKRACPCGPRARQCAHRWAMRSSAGCSTHSATQ
jgi:F-type H+-transporting ATPase subunit beta